MPIRVGGETKITSLLTKIERHLKQTQTTASRFGREVARDPRFVFDLRRGREPRDRTAARVLAALARLANRETAR